MRLSLLLVACAGLWGQDFRLDMILRKERIALAVPDLNASGAAQAWMAEFDKTLAADLKEAPMLDVRNKSYYPKAHPAQPTDVRPPEWSSPPVSAGYVTVGYGAVQADQFVFRGWLIDLSVNQAAIGATYLGPPSAAGARKAAHEFAADIIRRFGGEPLIGSKILFRSTRSGHKEIWAMDADGDNQRQLTDLKGLVVGLGVSPDGRSFSFATGWPSPPRLALFSFDQVRRLRFDNPEASLVSAPSFTPDGQSVLYSACVRDGCRIHLAGADGRNPRPISSGARVDSEPKVNPKSGRQILFVSDRGGPHQIYSMNLDGGDIERITNGEGYAANPSWHPNGQVMAFAWTRGHAPDGWNIFVMDVASRQFVQLTHSEGRNENPVWAPDGVHLVFTSTRSGSPQIWSMTADGNNLKQLTSRGANDTPVWSR